MLKLLITGALVYFIYRFFIAPPAIDEGEESSIRHDDGHKDTSAGHGDEYIDYEEID